MLHTRNELITWLYKNITDPILQQAMEWGRIENLGGFRPLPTSKNPGWIVRITSKRGRVFAVAVGVDNFKLYWFRLKEESIDWSLWIGEDAESELFRGDESGRGI